VQDNHKPQTLFKKKKKVVENLKLVADTARSVRDDRKRELDAAEADEKAKHEFRLSEVKRIDAEKDLLQQITAKLQTLLPGVELIEGRLSVTDYIVGATYSAHLMPTVMPSKKLLIKLTPW